jgi:hypothetical protein
MADTPRNPNVERVSAIPFEKDDVSPMPQYAPRARPAGTGTAKAPQPAAPAPPPKGEEYPGPQTSSSGDRSEPGRRPSSGADTTSREEE